MKQTLLVMLITLLSVVCSAQVQLNYTRDAIRKHLTSEHYEVTENFDKYGHYYLGAMESASYFLYYFDAKDICNKVVVVPKDKGVLNGLVEYYNGHYVILSSKKWKMYNENGIATVELVYVDSGCAFVWEIEKD